MERRDLMEKVLDKLHFYDTSYKSMTCEVCKGHSSMLQAPGAVFAIPKVGTLTYNLIGRTPKDVKDLPDLREKFKAINVNAIQFGVSIPLLSGLPST